MADLISVIVPVYQVAADLPRCLESILEQTHPHIEIVAVDDGSPDESGRILDSYAAKHPNLRVIHQENGGVTSARLRGVREAAGDWIGFVDGDDRIDRDMYRLLLENAEKYRADISHCGFRMDFPDGRVSYLHNTGCLRVQDHTQGLRDLLDGTMVEPSLCNKLFRRELFAPVLCGEGMLPHVKINEDLLMNFILFKQAQTSVFEDVCPYHYLVRQGSATRRELTRNRIYDPIRVKERILELAPASVEREAQAAFLRTCISVYNGIVLSNQAGLEQDRKAVRACILSRYRRTGTLSRKQRLLAALIRWAPWCYRPVYGFYAAHLLKNPYA